MSASEKPRSAWRIWLRHIALGLAAIFLLVAIFHRPLLHSIGRAVAIHFAAKEHLKLDLRIEGSVFTNLILRNVHVVPTGASAVESIDIDQVRADYSLWDLMRRGLSDTVKNVEVQSANIALDPSKAPPPPPTPTPSGKPSLPALFPERLRIADVNLTIRAQPQDLVVERLNLDLDPRAPGELRVDKVQIPGVHTWSKLVAQTSYTNKNLLLRDLALDQENQLRVLNIDASQIGAKSLRLALDASTGGGNISAAVSADETPNSIGANVRVTAANVSLERLSNYFGQPPGQTAGDVNALTLDWSGVLDSPKSWTGTASADIERVKQSGVSIDACQLRVIARDGLATIQSADISAGLNKIHLQGTAELPNSTAEFGRSPASVQLQITAPDLRELTASMPEPLRGAAQIDGRVEIKNGLLTTDLIVTAEQFAIAKVGIEHLNASVQASRQMPAPNVKKPYFADLISNIQLNAGNIRFGDYAIDQISGAIRSNGDAVTLDAISATRRNNNVVLRGKYRLPVDFSKASAQPANVDFNVTVPEIADYWMADAPDKITGVLEASGSVALRNGIADGVVTLFGRNIRQRSLVITQLSSQLSIAKSVLYLNDLTASLNERDFIAASGTFAFDRPFAYTGKVSANITDLAVFKPILAASGNKNDVAGSFSFNWQGSGQAAAFKNTGQLKVNLDKGRYANMQALQVNIDANYTPDGLDIPIIFLGSDKMDFQAILQAKGQTLEVSKIQVDQGQAKYASGYISVPFVWRNLGTNQPLFPSDGKVVATFQSENLDLKKLFDDLGAKSAPTGFINLKLEAGGTFSNLTAKFDMNARELRTAQLANFEPATFDLGVRIENEQLAVSGKLQQAKVQPVLIDANMPLNISKVVDAKKLDENTPIAAHVRMPKSSVNFVRQFVPAFSEVDGDLALDVNVNGTIAKPVFSGAGDMNVNVVRFANPTLPALTNFKSRLNFDRDVLTFTRFGGDLAGGPFGISGRVTFPKLTEPAFDLHLKAQAVLVARNDSLTARADANLNVVGPVKSATVSGDVSITNSQFLKNIDLIPIGLPGRPAPQPPADRPNLSFPQPPIRDWKFDVSIKTKDPFLIRGNLANGGALVDMKFVGTGLHPGLTGQVRLENVEATLPFSRLQIAYGFLYFDPSDSLNPKIDLHGTSVIRDYIVHVYVYGTSTSPEAVFTSEPPLPQEEIISLLATGTTRQELTGNSNVLAGRAGMLLVQQLYRKVFKKGAPTKSNSVFDRLQVEMGTPDPRTGQQSATARFKINDQFVLIGDLGLGGEFRGQVKYLLRFR